MPGLTGDARGAMWPISTIPIKMWVYPNYAQTLNSDSLCHTGKCKPVKWARDCTVRYAYVYVMEEEGTMQLGWLWHSGSHRTTHGGTHGGIKQVNNMTRIRYYVGLTTHGGQPVSAETQEKLTEVIASYYGRGCTIYSAIGYWKGLREESMIFEVLVPDVYGDGTYKVAEVLATLAHQSSVLWTAEKVQGGYARRKKDLCKAYFQIPERLRCYFKGEVPS